MEDIMLLELAAEAKPKGWKRTDPDSPGGYRLRLHGYISEARTL